MKLIILASLGGALGLMLLFFFPVFTESPLPHESLIQEHLHIYFFPAPQSVESILEVIDGGTDIMCAFRALNYEPLERILLQKGARLVINDDYLGNTKFHRPHVRFVGYDIGMMHSNYCVIDDETVITGSMIFNGNTMDFNFHDMLIIHNSEVASVFSSNFWQLYLNHTKVPAQDTLFNINSQTSMRVLFCPANDCEGFYVSLLDNATTSIDFAMFAFTNEAIISALQRASERGVVIRGVVEEMGITPSSVLYSGLPVRVDRFNKRVHTKLLVVDGRVSVTGTLNPSWRGVVHNDEVVVAVYNEEIASFYTDFIEYVYEFRY